MAMGLCSQSVVTATEVNGCFGDREGKTPGLPVVGRNGKRLIRRESLNLLDHCRRKERLAEANERFGEA
jgi:hypothetical protein